VLPLVSYFSGFKDGVDELEKFLDKNLVSQLRIPMDKETRIPALAKNIVSLIDKVSEKELGGDLSKIASTQYDWKHRARQMVEAFKKVK